MTAPAVAVGAAVTAQAAQTGLVIAMAGDLERAWSALHIDQLSRTLPDFTQRVAAVVHRYGAASGTLAARFYKVQRAEAGVTSPYTVTIAQLAPLPQIGKSLDWATQPLWAAQPDVRAAQVNVTGVAEKLILGTGRDTITGNVHRDPKATGWARVTEPAPCAFCALLATRGAVYKHDSADFRSHDHCRCHAEPVFGHYEPPARVREWQALYRDSTTGRNPARTRREWRRAFDAHTALQ